MPVQQADLDRLILRVHSAVLSEDGWDRIADDVCRTLSAESGIGLRVPSHAHPQPWAVLVNFDPNAAREYAKFWGAHDVWYHGAVQTKRISAGLVSVDAQLVDERDFGKSAFFNEYLRPLDIGRMIQVCLAGSEPDHSFGPAALSFYRGPKKEPFSPHEVKLLSHLAPHLAVAAQNYWTAQSLRLLRHLSTSAVDAVASGVFAIEGSGNVRFMNRAGQELLRQRRWVQISSNTLSPLSCTIEAASLAKALHRLSTGVAFRLIATDRVSGDQAIVIGAPISVSSVPPYTTGTTALVWVTPILPRDDAVRDVAQLFELTPAEQRLVSRLIAGDELREAAQRLEISIHTARAQIKAVFRKTGRRSQSQLLALVARIAAIRFR